MHKLSNVNITNRSAVCAECGPVRITSAGRSKRQGRRTSSGHITWECAQKGNLRDMRYKELVYNHYGRICVWCGDTDQLVLTVDHINNDGFDNRVKHFYRWIIRHNFPSDLQILCANCQLAKVRNGGVLPSHREHFLMNKR